MHSDYASQKWAQSVFVILAGGNDIKNDAGDAWPQILQRCVTEFNPFRGCHQNANNQPTNWDAVAESLFELYKLVGTQAAAAKIRVLGYPKLLQPKSGCGTVGGMSENESTWADEQVARLNVEIASSVNRAFSYFNSSVDISFVDVTPYVTFGACDNTDARQIHDLQLSWNSLVSDQSFHPTQKGYDGYYRALAASLREAGSTM